MQLFKAVLLSVAVILVFATGCKHPGKKGTVVLNVQAKYGNQYFALDTFDIDPKNRYVEVTTMQFYLSHMYLVKSDNSLVKVTDVQFFNIADASTLSLTVGDVPAGSYTGITFYCGVDSAQDTIISYNNPAFPPGLQAGLAYVYWPMIGYQFQHIEGKWDTAWLPTMRNGFAYHLGTKPYYRFSNVTGNFTVSDKTTTNAALVLEFEKVFFNGNQEIFNIQDNLGFSQTTAGVPVELAIADTFTTNFSKAFSLQ